MDNILFLGPPNCGKTTYFISLYDYLSKNGVEYGIKIVPDNTDTTKLLIKNAKKLNAGMALDKTQKIDKYCVQIQKKWPYLPGEATLNLNFFDIRGDSYINFIKVLKNETDENIEQSETMLETLLDIKSLIVKSKAVILIISPELIFNDRPYSKNENYLPYTIELIKYFTKEMNIKLYVVFNKLDLYLSAFNNNIEDVIEWIKYEFKKNQVEIFNMIEENDNVQIFYAYSLTNNDKGEIIINKSEINVLERYNIEAALLSEFGITNIIAKKVGELTNDFMIYLNKFFNKNEVKEEKKEEV